MKKVSIKKIIIICVLAASLFSGNFDYTVYCVAEECCKTVCCNESSGSDYSGLHLSFNNSGCCEYNQAPENEIQAISSLNTTVKKSITAPSAIHHQIPGKHDCSYIIKKSSTNHFPESHSISILRI